MTQQQYNNNFEREFGWDDTIQRIQNSSYCQKDCTISQSRTMIADVTRRTRRIPASCQLVQKQQSIFK